jgi:hypothetical protein
MARRLSWAERRDFNWPRAMASRTSSSERADNVNITTTGLVRMSVAIGEESERQDRSGRKPSAFS